MYSFLIRKKINICLLLIGLFLLLLINSQSAYAQSGNVLEQKINVSLKNVPVKQVLDELSKQIDYRFAYSSNALKANGIVNVHYSDITLHDALQQLFGEQLQTVRVSGKQIFLQLKQVKNKGTIKGKVQTSDGKPAESVSVQLQGTGTGTITKDDGSYELKAPEGKYLLVTSYAGLQTQTQNITVQENETVNADFTLAENNEQLQDVLVSSVNNKFSNKESNYVAKMPLKNLENPQVYNIVPSALMREQMLTNFNDAMKNIPGVTMNDVNAGFFAAFFSSRGFTVKATMRDGVALGNSSDLDPANIESIEMLKGPAGTLFGSALVSWGGMINITTKKPYGHLGGEVSYTGGSYGLNRYTADINVPLTRDSTVALRVNAARTTQGSYMDYGFSKSTFLSPVISYKPNDRMEILLEADFYTKTATPQLMIFTYSLPNSNIRSPQDLNMDYRMSYTNNTITFNTPATNILGRINYKMSNQWQSQTVLSFGQTESSGFYQSEAFNSTGDSVSRGIADYEGNISNIADIQQNFIGDYQWGTIRNRLVAGLDFYSIHSSDNFNYINYDMVAVHNPGTQYFNITPSLIDQYKIENNLTSSGSNSKSYIYAAYLSDVVNVGDHFIANAGLRIDRFDNKGNFNQADGTTSGKYKQTALSPKFGLIYQPVKDRIAFFANYSNGYSNVNGSDFYGKPFKPANGNQLEGGIKIDILKETLSTTVSYYNIHASNLTENDPEHSGFSIQDMKQSSQGVEATINTAPFNGFNLLAGYSYNYKKTAGIANNISFPGNTGNLYASYAVTTGKAKGIGFSIGGNYTGAIYPQSGSELRIPPSTIFNASAFYDKLHYRLGLKINNLTNKEYWIGSGVIEPQMLREILVTIGVKF